MSDKWGPLEQEAMSAFIQGSYDADDMYNREREYVTCEVGLDRPVNTFYVRRGATDAELSAQLAMIKEVCEKYEHNPYFEENDNSKAYTAELKKFATAPESEIHLIFHEDCQGIDPPLVIGGTFNDKEWNKTFHDEWNALANWSNDHAMLGLKKFGIEGKCPTLKHVSVSSK